MNAWMGGVLEDGKEVLFFLFFFSDCLLACLLAGIELLALV